MSMFVYKDDMKKRGQAPPASNKKGVRGKRGQAPPAPDKKGVRHLRPREKIERRNKMANTTKKVLEVSLKKLLKEKPFDKITIADLTGDCGISRMTFYYHFQDIYELAEWVCIEDGKQALKDKKTYDTWQEGMIQVFEAVLENKPFIANIYRSVDKAKIENYLYKLSYQLIADVVDEKCAGDNLSEADKQFIADFYKYGFVGIMLDWVDKGMKDDYHKIVEQLSTTLRGNIANSIHNFEIEM